MATASHVDRIRKSALESADRAERNFYWFVLLLGVLELTTAVLYVLLAVYGFSEPVLIGVAGACVYCLLGAGLFGLKFHMDTTTNRIISALQLLAEEADEAEQMAE